MNEELQSTNEELETINDEVRQRSLELNEINAFLETILSSMGVAVIVIDREQRVQIWNAESTEFWGVRSDEAHGQHLFGLDIGLPLDGVRAPLRRVLAGTDDRAEVRARGAQPARPPGPRQRHAPGARRSARTTSPARSCSPRRGRRAARRPRPTAPARAERPTPPRARSGRGRSSRRARERAITVAVRAHAGRVARRGSASIRARSAAMSAASSGARSCVRARRARSRPPRRAAPPRDASRRGSRRARRATGGPRSAAATRRPARRSSMPAGREVLEREADRRAPRPDEPPEGLVGQVQREQDARRRHAPQRSPRCPKKASRRRSTRGSCAIARCVDRRRSRRDGA